MTDERLAVNELRPPHKPSENKKDTKRGWSAGETVFNYGVYGGISWIVNEILSTIITNTIYARDMVKAGPKSSLLQKLFNPNGTFHKPFETTYKVLHRYVNPFKWSATPFFLITEMFVMTIGGNLLVPPVKWLEDRKGKIVRGLDRFFHGGKDDPKLEALHKEMDDAPKQSWGSLIKGRLLVLAGAIGMHFVMGAERTEGEHRYVAPTTRWLQGTFMEKYSNLTRIMRTGTRDILSLSWMPFVSKEQKEAMRAMRAMPGVPGMREAEGKFAVQMGNTFGYVLSVSAAVAVLFFVSSRFFAAARDRVKSGHENKNTADVNDITLNKTQAASEQLDEHPKKEEIKLEPAHKPVVQVGSVQHEQTLEARAIGALQAGAYAG